MPVAVSCSNNTKLRSIQTRCSAMFLHTCSPNTQGGHKGCILKLYRRKTWKKWRKSTTLTTRHGWKAKLAYTMKAYRGSRCITPLILNMGKRRRQVFRVTPRPLQPKWKRSVTDYSDIQSTDNQCLRTSGQNIYRRPVCKYCYKAWNQSTKYELNN